MVDDGRNSSHFISLTGHEIESSSKRISDDLALCLQYVIYTVFCQIIDVFGVGSNIINIICFIKQGFKDPINISLLGLAVSDFGCLFTLIWTNICYTPAFWTAELPFDSIDVMYMTGGVPHTIFTRVTGWITALITLERCLCVTMPLKMKTLITPRRVAIITSIIFVVLIATAAPEYAINKLDYKYFPLRNKTMIGLTYIDNRESIAKISYLVNNVVIPFSSCFVIILCTTILVYQLQINTKWRKISATAQADTFSYRNQKVSKMVVLVSALFIVCFIPISMAFLAVSLEKELFLDGEYRNSLIVMAGICLIIESINSSANIFIYYYMSRNYRNAFHQLFKNINSQ